MENSSEQSRWVSSSLISPDQLANYTTEPGLLPPGEDDEPFYSSSETDLLPSYYSTSGQSRASSSYRHSPGEIFTAAFKWYCKYNKRSGGVVRRHGTIVLLVSTPPFTPKKYCHKRAILVSPNNLSMNS